MCPTGNGIQSPKLFEAMLARVVPIVTREPAFEDLAAYGFPLLIVDSWFNLSSALLTRQYDEQYRHTHWTLVDYMMTGAGVFDLILQGKYPQ